jgi:hypothetical protein
MKHLRRHLTRLSAIAVPCGTLPANVVFKSFTLFPTFPVLPRPGEFLRQRVETIRLMRTVKQCVGGGA